MREGANENGKKIQSAPLDYGSDGISSYLVGVRRYYPGQLQSANEKDEPILRRFVIPMKKIIILATLLAFIPTQAHAEDTGAWVAVDAAGNAISQAIVCTPSVCGNSQNPFMGQHWVLQAPADKNGNVAGIGAGQGAESVKVDLATNTWTVTNSSTYTNPVTKETIKQTTTQQFTPEQAYWNNPVTPGITTTNQEVIAAQLEAQQTYNTVAKKLKRARKATKK